MQATDIKLIDITLREGEQFAKAFFTTEMKVHIAKLLDELGAEYIEVTSPACSPQSWKDAETLAKLGLNAKIAAHVRCTQEDIDISLDAGVDVIHMMYATSPILQKYSHGKNIDQIRESAIAMTEYLVGKGIEVRFSGEDATRSRREDLEYVYDAVVAAGVNRLGLPDTTGIATPDFIKELYTHMTTRYDVDFEFHGHNDCGCTVANAYAAILGGATHIDVSILGIGERNGITPIGGLIARLYPQDREMIAKYNLKKIVELDKYVADILQMPIPFNNYFSSDNAFHHGAGIHTNAILRNPGAYELFDLDDFGVSRSMEVGHRLIGKNIIAKISEEMGIKHTRDELLQITAELKALTDSRRHSEEEVRDYIRKWVVKNGN
jgi:homocitrate synthase